ncbi:MAG: hypothetical protein P8Y04_12695 [Desulfobulbaceae bacterium]
MKPVTWKYERRGRIKLMKRKQGSKDIMQVPEEEIPQARVDLTIVGGEIRYDRRSDT